MDIQDKIKRKVEITKQLSERVYKIEEKYITDKTQTGDMTSIADDILFQGKTPEERQRNKTQSPYTLINAKYDHKTGVASVAVEDKETKETYLIFAGTNKAADGFKDINHDVGIALNNQTMLKNVDESALKMYEELEKKGRNITTVGGHSYGGYSASTIAMLKQVPYVINYNPAPLSVDKYTLAEN